VGIEPREQRRHNTPGIIIVTTSMCQDFPFVLSISRQVRNRGSERNQKTHSWLSTREPVFTVACALNRSALLPSFPICQVGLSELSGKTQQKYGEEPFLGWVLGCAGG
jgi:hypothetical protein